MLFNFYEYYNCTEAISNFTFESFEQTNVQSIIKNLHFESVYKTFLILISFLPNNSYHESNEKHTTWESPYVKVKWITCDACDFYTQLLFFLKKWKS